jgi:hypothetical protein
MESRRPNALIRDEKAMALAVQMSCDFRGIKLMIIRFI